MKKISALLLAVLVLELAWLALPEPNRTPSPFTAAQIHKLFPLAK